jgi:hypothetical protein
MNIDLLREPETDPVELRRALNRIIDFLRVIEIRVMKVQRGYGRPVNYAGFFDDPEAATNAIMALARYKACYFTLNKLPAEMRSIRNNRLDAADDSGLTADKHIVRLVQILIDFDPTRVHPEIPSNDSEHAAAGELATTVMGDLETEGWPLPVMIDSGNGYGLWYRIDLPTVESALVKRVLEAANSRWGTPAVKIDCSVFNPARITKLPGTVNRKGDHTPDRPHRVARLVSQFDSFDEVDTVPRPLLEALAATAPMPESTRLNMPAPFRPSTWPVGEAARAALEADAARWGLRCSGVKADALMFTMHLAACPFDASHVGKDSAVCVDLATGQRGFKCFHDSCSKYSYRDFRNKVDPGAVERAPVPRRSGWQSPFDVKVSK